MTWDVYIKMPNGEEVPRHQFNEKLMGDEEKWYKLMTNKEKREKKKVKKEEKKEEKITEKIEEKIEEKIKEIKEEKVEIHENPEEK